MDFWYKFDLLFNPGFDEVPPDILEAWGVVSGLVFGWLAAQNESSIKNCPEIFWIMFHIGFISISQPVQYQTRF
jgi:hypothetical protein